MTDVRGLSEGDAEFAEVCHQIVTGLGFERANPFGAEGIEQSWRGELVRESTDGMYHSVEVWLCTFARSLAGLSHNGLLDFANAAIAADVRFLLAVIFGTVADEEISGLLQALQPRGIHLVLLTGLLAEALAADFGGAERNSSQGFSFHLLRQHTRQQVAMTEWQERFQTTSVLPNRVLPLDADEAALSESDLIRVLHGGSFLLLGEPGAGKTTSLLALAGELASAGGLTPVFVPLGRYRGDFWEMLADALAPGSRPVSSRAVCWRYICLIRLVVFERAAPRQWSALLFRAGSGLSQLQPSG